MTGAKGKQGEKMENPVAVSGYRGKGGRHGGARTQLMRNSATCSAQPAS
jgi:hypothetical protein